MKNLQKNLPDKPGVYLFRKGTEVLYAGKATNLRDRVRSYFSPDLMETRGPKLVKMLELASSVDYKETDSVLEALLLEAVLIKKYKPKYNSDLKDDKSFSYVVITKENFPRVLIVRGKELVDWTEMTKEIFGPFPHGSELREALKIIRKIFPYRDRCFPSQVQTNPGGETSRMEKRCFNAQLGLCPGVCTGKISKKEYAKVIRSVKLLFQGKKQVILRGLEKHMKAKARVQNFEKAVELRNKIFALNHINDIVLLKRNLAARRLSEGGGLIRIEGYDVAHISGTSTVGVMVVMEGGALAKDEYRKFKIRTRKNDDPGSLRELLERRFKHKEWQLPDLVVIDGGQVQKNVAQTVLRPMLNSLNTLGGGGMSVVSVVKNEKHKPDHILGDSRIIRDYHHDILAINAEAHRFAIAYHRLLRGRVLK